MSLSTFSAILDFAIKEEQSGIDFLASSSKASSGPRHEPLARIQAEAEKSLKALRTMLRENITELVMEPFEPLDEAGFAFHASGGDPVADCRRLLTAQRDFLLQAAGVVNLREVRRAFERMADRKNQLISEIDHVPNR